MLESICRDIYSIPYPCVSCIQRLWIPGEEKARWPNSRVLAKYHPPLPVLEAGCGVGNEPHSVGCLSQSCRIWNFSNMLAFCLFISAQNKHQFLRHYKSFSCDQVAWGRNYKNFSIFTEQNKPLYLYMGLKDPVGIYWGIFIPHSLPHMNSVQFHNLTRPDP